MLLGHLCASKFIKYRMKVYVAVTYLDRAEWAGDTVYSVVRGGFELCLRRFLQNETGDRIAAHVSLFFENTPDWIHRDIGSHIPASADPSSSFFIDVLSNGTHEVSSMSDGQNWYRRWNNVRVELYEVAPMNGNGRVLDAGKVYRQMISYLKTQRSYDCYQNCNSILSWPTRCSPTMGLCCPCSNGTNCIEAVAVSLASGYNAPEWYTERALGLDTLKAMGSRLPSTFRDELLESGVILAPPRVVRWGENTKIETAASVLPFVMIR